MSNFWFENTTHIIDNHLLFTDILIATLQRPSTVPVLTVLEPINVAMVIERMFVL